MVKVDGLSFAQRVAINALSTGLTTERAAQLAGVSRQAVSTWVNRDVTFRTELVERQEKTAAAFTKGVYN